MKTSYTLWILVILATWGCNNQNTESEHSHEPVAVSNPNASLIELTDTQMEKIGLQTGKIDSQALTNTRKFNGYIASHPRYKADITSLIDGMISDIRILPGQRVSKGQVLMSLENAEIIEWQREYITHLNEFKFMEKEYERQKELFANNFTAAREFQQIESDYNVLQGDLKSLRTKLEMVGLDPGRIAAGSINRKLQIRSPISGYVDDLSVNNGAYIQNFETLTTVINPEHLHIEINVFEKDLPFISENSRVIFWTTSDESKRYEANVFSVGRTVNPRTRTVQVHADILGDHYLSEGMYIQARVIIDQGRTACLPSEAIVADQGLNFIFAKEHQTENGSLFRKVPVLTGVSDMGFTEVEPMEPLDPNADIVVNGTFYILAQSKTNEGGGIVEH